MNLINDNKNCKKLISNLNINGFTTNEDFINSFSNFANFNNICASLNLFFNDEHIILKGEKIIVQQIENTFEKICDESNYNSNILDLEEKLLENEIELLEEEFQIVEADLNKEKTKIKLEEYENEHIIEHINKLKEKNRISKLIFTLDYQIFEDNYFNKLIEKWSILCSNSIRIISEFDMNLKNVKNENKIMVGFKKLDCKDFDDIMKTLEIILEELVEHYNDFRVSNNNTKSNQNLVEFVEIISKYDKLLLVYEYIIY